MKKNLIGVSLSCLFLVACGSRSLGPSKFLEIEERLFEEHTSQNTLPFAEYQTFKHTYKDVLPVAPKKQPMSLLEKELANHDKSLEYLFAALDSGVLASSLEKAFLPQKIDSVSDDIAKFLFPGERVKGKNTFWLKIDSTELKKKMDSFFIDNLTKIPQESLFFQYAFADSDDATEKKDKRNKLQDEFQTIVSSAISLELEEVKKSVRYIDVIANLLFTAKTKDLVTQIEQSITTLVPKIYDINRGGKLSPTITLPERVNPSKLPMDLSRILNVVIPQGGDTDAEFAKVRSPFEAEKLKNMIASSKIALSSDTISTRDARAVTGRVDMKRLKIDGTVGGSWNLNQSFYVAAKGVLENGKMDDLSGVLSYQGNCTKLKVVNSRRK